MNNLNAEETIGYVTKIIENVRCATCDKLEGPRWRYPCGHTVCDNCITYSEDCKTCISPPRSPVCVPTLDHPLTQAVANACDLLKICQNLFGVDAFHRKRISEQLRIEKELFPKCIQAPVKYENKRKSKNISFENKENYSTFFPGEATSSPKQNIMENSVKNVQQWFNKNEARKPFADLHVNTNVINQKDIIQNVKDKNVGLQLTRKRSFAKTLDKYSHPAVNKKKIVYDCDKSPKKVKIDNVLEKNEIHNKCEIKTGESFTSFISSTNDLQKKFDYDESGIFMDNDPIVIDDSQETHIDKDKRAWLAVLEACKDETLESTSLYTSNQVNNTNDNSKQLNNSSCNKKGNVKVPFFKKGAITETCKYCRNELNSTKAVLAQSQTQPVKITIDGGSFFTTITVLQNVDNNVPSSNSVSVQTNSHETSENCMKKNNSQEPKRFSKKDAHLDELEDDIQSEDLFVDDRIIFEDVAHVSEVSKGVVIEESDTDSDLDISGPVSVKADVHRSCEEFEYGTLTEIVDLEDHDKRPRRGPRGLTPTSTDSSEKENYNPNRMRRRKNTKKKYPKK